MLPITIDLNDVIQEFTLTEEQSSELGKRIIDAITTEYVHNWQDIINSELSSTRRDYMQAMYVDRVSDTEVVFGLTRSKENPLPMMLEEGSPPFDEKVGFSNSSKRKNKKNGGWYLTIPFRHATSSAVAESALFSSVLPKEVQAVTKKKNTPLRVADLPAKYQVKGVRAEIPGLTGNQGGSYTHKTPKYAGLVRLEVGVGNEKSRGTYFTFRRVSDKSAANSWIHPGFVSGDFMGKALTQSDISNVAGREIDRFLEER